MSAKDFFKKLQELPDDKKRIIMWAIVIIAGLIMAFFWISGAAKDLSVYRGSLHNVQIPSVQMPQLDALLQTTSPSNK